MKRRQNPSYEQLFQDMKVLAIRYGVDKCQRALDAAQLSLAPKRTAKPNNINPSHHQDWDAVCRLRSSLIPKKTHAKNNLAFFDDALPQVVKPYLDVMEQHYDIHCWKRVVDPDSTPIRQVVDSVYHTLYLYTGKTHTMYEVLNRKKCVALFERVLIGPQTSTSGENSHRPIHNKFLDSIVSLVVRDRLISSLVFTKCLLRYNQALRLARLLETNHLRSIEFSRTKLLADGDAARFGQALTHSLRNHANMFQERSMLKDIDFRDPWGEGEPGLYRDFFNVIGLLPSLEWLTVNLPGHELLEPLAGSIGQWKISHFRLLCAFWVEPNTVDFRPIFEAIANSAHIKVFAINCIEEHEFLPQSISQQLFDLALSPNSSLVDILVRKGAIVDLRQLSSLIPNNVDPTVAAGRKLRQFIMIHYQTMALLKTANEDMSVCLANLEALLTLLSKQLPYLHSIGLTMFWWRHYKSCNYISNSVQVTQLWNRLLVQMERNRVGMALFESSTLSTVPAGLWPVVLHRAITHEEDSQIVPPWTGIYHMVQGLFQGGHTGWNEQDKKRGRKEDDHMENRPKKVRASVNGSPHL